MTPIRAADRQCVGKIAYDSKRNAKRTIGRIRPRERPMSAYRCPWCGGIHIGKKPRTP